MKSQQLKDIAERLISLSIPIEAGIETPCGNGARAAVIKFDITGITDDVLLSFFEQCSVPNECEFYTLGESQNVEKTQSAYTYLMVDRNTGFHKIGKSINPQKRERTLQSEKPVIDLLGYCAGWIVSEDTLHDMYAHLRVRGEWFNLSKSDVQHILKIFAA